MYSSDLPADDLVASNELIEMILVIKPLPNATHSFKTGSAQSTSIQVSELVPESHVML